MEELDYQKLYEEEKRKNSILKGDIDSFSLPSSGKLYYALNRQQNDLADMLNTVKIKDIDISSTSDKSIERLEKIWKSIGTLAPLVNMLGTAAGILGEDEGEVKPKRRMVSPESYAQEIGDNKTQDV